MSSTIAALEWRYATKKFDASKKLNDDQLRLLKKAFNLTASSYGLQPVNLLVIDDPVLKESLKPLSMDQDQVVDCSHLLVLCIEEDVDTAYVNQYFETVKDVRNTPDEIIKPFREYLVDHFKEASQDDVQLWASKQAYLALGNLLTVCALEGIDACPMEGFDPKAYDKKLGLADKGLKSVLLLPVGYRAAEDPFAEFKKVRKERVVELEGL